MSRREHAKSPASLETVITVTAIVTILCCSLFCDNVSCSSHQESAKGKSDTDTVSDENADGRQKNLLSAVNKKLEDIADSKSFHKEDFRSSKTSCDIFYMVVSTIDGKVSALDLMKQGSFAWSIEADSHPLYLSSLAQMEIVRNGKKIRLIPSLDGAIYQFDGEKFEALPMSADSLLSSTYKLSDDSMIVGSKDIRNYGINLRTGQIQFACGSDGCTNQEETENSSLNGNDVVIVTRSTQIIRSVDMKNGVEKWNFSVGEHRLSVPPSTPQSEIEDLGDNKDDTIPFLTTPKKKCPEKNKNPDEVDYESLLQFLVPEGKVVALDKKHSQKVAWEHKFESPIAKVWLLRNGKIESINLFDPKYIPTLSAFAGDDLENESSSQPLLYIGSHNKLLYIQPSPQVETILKTFPTHRIGHVFDPKIQVSWRPYLSTAAARTPIFGGNRQSVLQDKDKTVKEKETSLAVWHEDYPFDTGYFLYPEFRDSRSTKKGQMLLLENLHQVSQETNGFIEALPASIWLYWKEFFGMSAVVSILVHLLLTKFFRKVIIPPINEDEDSMESGKHDKSNNHELNSSSENINSPCDQTSGEYVSRFSADFECLQCLGRGGFGIVFEAVNKLDGQHYAVKRIMLPKRDGAKEKVLREVKALAQLEHPGIVRYFNSWEESPPAGWQKQWDLSRGLCEDTKENFYISTKSQTTEQSQVKEKEYSDGKVKSEALLDGNTTDTDSVVFLPEDSVLSQTGLPGNGSGEFSVHSELSETNSWSQEFSDQGKNERLFSHFGNLSSKSGDGSQSGSKSSIPFSNYTSNSSKNDGNSKSDLSGDSVVFEASGLNVSKQPPPKDCVPFSKLSSAFTLSDLCTEKDEDAESGESQNSMSENTFFLYIQTQLYQKETLKDWLSSNTLNRQRQVILEIFDQITCAVDYVHSHDLMHRDLKPSNIFFSADGTVKVGDFGLATALSAQQDHGTMNDENASLPGRHTADVGTTLYMSPEQKDRKPYDLKVDIFAMGLILLELWVPFATQMERIRTLQDAKRHILPSRFSRELPIESELVRRMTSQDPSLRPNTREILNHELLNEVATQRIDLRKRARTISDNSNS